MYLENIYSPADVKKLSFQELNDLSHEIRASLLQKLSAHGGHFGPNFGMVDVRGPLPPSRKVFSSADTARGAATRDTAATALTNFINFFIKISSFFCVSSIK